MKHIKSLKSQLVLQFAIIVLPVIAILLYQTVSNIHQDEQLARSYHYLNTCHGIRLKYTQFINGAVDAVDTGRLGMGALRALEEAAEKLKGLAQEDNARNFINLQGTMDSLLAALRNDRSITALMALREFINRADAELGNEYLRYEQENRQAIEANIAFANTQKTIVLAAIFATFLLSMIVGRLITRSITRPITEAVAFAQSIILDSFTELSHGTAPLAQKELTSREKVKATGEVQVLVDSINRMAEELGERSRELLDAQEELVRKEKLATLGQLSGSVGHELRNPLGVMSNAVYFLKMVLTEADETTREYLDIIKHEIENSQRIISDLLDFARTKPPQTKSVGTMELVAQCIGKCTIPGGVTLLEEISETLPPLRVDPQQMGQVLHNLITNAIQAMPDGGALRVAARRILNSELAHMNSTCTIHNSQYDGDFIEISVTDSGAGISPENMKKIFQPLFTTKAKGIGLGLVVCRNLVETNGGRIEVVSRLGEGTTFTVILPLERGET
jgi:signal transduction histidine kinase